MTNGFLSFKISMILKTHFNGFSPHKNKNQYLQQWSSTAPYLSQTICHFKYAYSTSLPLECDPCENKDFILFTTASSAEEDIK